MSEAEARPKLFFIANCMYRHHLAGGDVHFFHMAEAAVDAGYDLHMFGGHAVKAEIDARKLPVKLTLTDDKALPAFPVESLQSQLKLLKDYYGRYRRSIRRLREIGPDDIVYAVTDYWFDAWPALRSAARRKLMILGMDAPTFGQILTRGRPDVSGTRLASVYYSMSQNISLGCFRRCRTKRLFYVHPDMEPRLLRFGYTPGEIRFLSNGVGVRDADAVPSQAKEFDVAWAGRVHPQKGIDDLARTLAFLAAKLENFRAVIVGRVENELGPRLRAMGLGTQVHFAGFVPEKEKFRLFKASRVFLMPSRYESWGIVVAEALASETPVVAYRLDAYPGVFGDLVRYVPCFDSSAFEAAALDAVQRTRMGERLLHPDEVERFKNKNSWQETQRRFCETLRELKN